MDFDNIKLILDLVREHDLTEFELEQDGLKLRVRKGGSGQVAYVPAPAPVPVAAPLQASASGPAAVPSVAAPAEPAEGVDLAVIRSPIVGTFYRSSEPGARAFVEVGDIVKKGQVLCIIEAMKLMNEIDSEYDGEIAAVYVESGQSVQYGERLFAIRTR